jgi:hypothetical protein
MCTRPVVNACGRLQFVVFGLPAHSPESLLSFYGCACLPFVVLYLATFARSSAVVTFEGHVKRASAAYSVSV